MRRRFGRQQGLGGLGPVAEVNMTPLIDLAFSLLIIFMMTTPLLERTLPIALPVTDPDPAQASPQAVQAVHIDASGQFSWGAEPVSLETLSAYLAQLSQAPQPPVLHIRAAGQGTYQPVATVLSLAQRHGLTRVHLDTEVRAL